MLMKTESLGPQLLSYHNIAYMMRLIREMRQSILEGDFPDYSRAFMRNMFPESWPAQVPAWVVKACAAAGFDVLQEPLTDKYPRMFATTPRANSVPSGRDIGYGAAAASSGAGAGGDE